MTCEIIASFNPYPEGRKVYIPDIPVNDLSSLDDIFETAELWREKPSEDYITISELSPEEKSGKLLKAARLRADLTQKQLGEKIHRSERTIRNWETNKSSIPSDMVTVLASILNMREEYFIK